MENPPALPAGARTGPVREFLTGVVVALVILLGLLILLVSLALQPNGGTAINPPASETAVPQAPTQLATQVAESVPENEAARVEHQRVALQRLDLEMVGIWSGRFHVRGAHLKITRNDNAIRAVFLVGRAQAVYQGEIVERGRPAGSVLLLTPVRQTGDTRGGGMLRIPLILEAQSDGTLKGRTDNNDIYCCQIEMGRVTDIDGVSGSALTELFQERTAIETEFVPKRELHLCDDPGDLVWDSLEPSEVKSRQLHLFGTGLVATVHGSEFHHIVVRGLNYEERKAWIIWDQADPPAEGAATSNTTSVPSTEDPPGEGAGASAPDRSSVTLDATLQERKSHTGGQSSKVAGQYILIRSLKSRHEPLKGRSRCSIFTA